MSYLECNGQLVQLLVGGLLFHMAGTYEPYPDDDEHHFIKVRLFHPDVDSYIPFYFHIHVEVLPTNFSLEGYELDKDDVPLIPIDFNLAEYLEDQDWRNGYFYLDPYTEDYPPVVDHLDGKPDDPSDVGFDPFYDPEIPDPQDTMDRTDSFSDFVAEMHNQAPDMDEFYDRKGHLPIDSIQEVMSKEFHDANHKFQGEYPESLDVHDAHVMAWLDYILPF